jgi:uncharacterized membrane protein YraQ (UPF0718 family)
MHYLYLATAILLGISFFKDRAKTRQALKLAGKKLLKILPAFLSMLVFVSLVLYMFPQETISSHLVHQNKWLALGIASFFGSLTLMPGFIAYPLGGILRSQGVPYMVLSGFTTTLMMVGLLTFPVEKAYLGTRVAVIRNVLSLVIALIIAVLTGLAFGEIQL